MASDARLTLHPKQMQVFKSPKRFKVVVAGRRWGKCLHSDTMISMADGSERRIEDVRPGELVLTVNEDTYTLEPRKVQHVLDNGVKETVVVKTAGRALRCTPNHPLLTNNRWVNAGEIKPGDLVAVPKRLAFGNKRLPDHVVVLLALWLAEGSDYAITNSTPEIIAEMMTAAAKIDIEPQAKDGLNWRFFNGDRSGGPQAGSKNPLRLLIESFGLWGKDSKTKFIPDEVFDLPEDQLARFLNLFIACDGNISKRTKSTWSLEIGLANERMVHQLAKLLHKFGIRGQVRHKVHAATSRRTGQRFESWSFIASTPDAIRCFAHRIGALSKESHVAKALEAANVSRGNSNAYLPIAHDEFVKHLSYIPVKKGRHGGYNYTVARDLPEELRASLTTWRKQTPTRISVRRYEQLRSYSDGFYDPLWDADVAWEEVTAVETAEPAQTWDLTVEGNHNFIAEGIVTHNTQLSKVTIIKRAAAKPNQHVWYVAPTYRMAKQIMWQDLIDGLPPAWIKRINETTMTIRLVNGSVIGLRGADKPDTLRGVGLHFLVLDEFQDMKPEVWTKVLRPTLASTGGHVLIIGTPKAFNHLYELYQLGQRGETYVNDKGVTKANPWESWQFPTITSPFIPDEEVEAARRDMDEKSFRQEFEASFEAMSGRVYYAFDRRQHVGKYEFNPALPIWIGQDFNIDPMSSIVLQPQPNGEIWAVDEIVLYGSNTLEVCDEIERRYWRHLKQIVMYPDPAGGARQHARGETDLDIMREKGLKKIKYRRAHPPIADRVNAVNKMLMAADGTVRLRIDERCRNFINSLEQTMYKPGGRDIDKSANIEHITDAAGYCIELEFPVRRIEVAGLSI